jgi:hypothetical protein
LGRRGAFQARLQHHGFKLLLLARRQMDDRGSDAGPPGRGVFSGEGRWNGRGRRGNRREQDGQAKRRGMRKSVAAPVRSGQENHSVHDELLVPSAGGK